jgi:hypothetical protein
MMGRMIDSRGTSEVPGQSIDLLIATIFRMRRVEVTV